MRYGTVFLITLIYALGVTFISCFHELWRDEVVPIVLTAQSGSLVELFHNIRNYGHPGLWYVLLYAGHQLIPHYFVLKIVNITVAVCAVFVFLLRAPFSRVQKFLFLGGIFPLYLYPVLNRNYGISMLLIFLLASLYKDRFKNIIPIALVLFLLASAHAHSLIIVLAVTASLFLEVVFSKKEDPLRACHPFKATAAFLIIAFGVALTIWQIIPDETSSIFQASSLTIKGVLMSFGKCLLVPGKLFRDLFGFGSGLFVTAIIGGMYVYLTRNRYLFVMFACGVIGLAMFFDLIYPSAELRHQGSLYLLMIFVLWVDHFFDDDQKMTAVPFIKKGQRLMAQYKNPFFIFLLIIHVCMAYAVIQEDVVRDYSSSKRFAAFVKGQPDLKEAIIMGEPGSGLEALPYYMDNDLYIAREQRFGSARQFTTASLREMTFEGLLSTAQMLREKFNRPIIVLLGHKVTPQGPFQIETSYGKVFTYSKASLESFLNKTTKIADFHGAITSENYDVFMFK